MSRTWAQHRQIALAGIGQCACRFDRARDPRHAPPKLAAAGGGQRSAAGAHAGNGASVHEAMVPRGTHPNRRTAAAPADHPRRAGGPPDRSPGPARPLPAPPSRSPASRDLASIPSVRPASREADCGRRRNLPASVNASVPLRIRISVRAVRNERPRPRTKIASSRLVLPEALAPLIRLQRASSSSSARATQRKSSMTRRRGSSNRPSRDHSRIGITTYREVLSVPERIRQLLLPSVSPIWTSGPSIAASASSR